MAFLRTPAGGTDPELAHLASRLTSLRGPGGHRMVGRAMALVTPAESSSLGLAQHHVRADLLGVHDDVARVRLVVSRAGRTTVDVTVKTQLGQSFLLAAHRSGPDERRFFEIVVSWPERSQHAGGQATVCPRHDSPRRRR